MHYRLLTLEELLDAADRRTLPSNADLEMILLQLLQARPTMISTPRSTFAREVGYDGARGVVHATTTGGEWLRYLIPRGKWEAMRRAVEYGSLGTFWQDAVFGHHFGLPVAKRRRP